MRVYLIASTKVQIDEIYRFLEDENIHWVSDTPDDASLLIEACGRLCYMSYEKPRPGGAEAYIRHLIDSGHGSVLEHASWTFLVTGVSRTLTHELVRHRHLSFSQLSHRYTDDPGDAVIPEAVRANPEAALIWREAVDSARVAYDRILDCLSDLPRKEARSAARSVLPHATPTKIAVTGNARAWRHFLVLRGSPAAEAEIRSLALAIHAILSEESPLLFGDIRREGDFLVGRSI